MRIWPGAGKSQSSEKAVLRLLADTKRELCGELGILNEGDGVAERATFIIDPEDIIQFVYVLGMEVPRDAGEVLRVLAYLKAARSL